MGNGEANTEGTMNSRFSGPDVDRDTNTSKLEIPASRLNGNLMREMQKALENDPETDLLSLFPTNYLERLRRQEKIPTADNAVVELNQEVLQKLQDRFAENAEFNLLSAVPYDYAPIYAELRPPKAPAVEAKGADFSHGPDVRGRIHTQDESSIVFPLSDTVKKLLSEFSGDDARLSDTSANFTPSLVRLLWASDVLYDFATRMILKCSDEIAAKILGGVDTTEYSALRYLESNLPSFPAPRPHGLIRIGDRAVLFMSYIPSKDLGAVWPKLSQENKVSIQTQLQDLFTTLRTLRQDDGHPLGGVGGEGIKDDRMSLRRSDRPILSAAEFEDFQFSNAQFGSSSYIQLLRGFLPAPATTSVFTHSDVRKPNIMVREAQKGWWIVTGIVDWEDSGFYPDYFECTKLTRVMNIVDEEDDWPSYLPPCISPAQFPTRWLVDRIWDKHVQWT